MTTYIDLLNSFYARLQCSHITNNGQLLYYTLLAINNKAGWAEWFPRTNVSISSMMRISEKTFLNAREELIQLGLIRVIASKKRGECTRYHIVDPAGSREAACAGACAEKVRPSEQHAGITAEAVSEAERSAAPSSACVAEEKMAYSTEAKEDTLEIPAQDSVQTSAQSTAQTPAQSTVQTPAQSTVQTPDIIRLRLKDNKKSMSNDIPEKPPEPKYGAGSFELRCVERLIDSLRRQYPGAKTPETAASREKWADEIERMKRLDKRSEEEILEALEYATTNPFWQCNIRSAKKLREKCETLILQARGRQGQQGKAPPKNRFHNLEEHGYDYDAMVWDMMGMRGSEVK
ncbi:hypothetical protein [Otoolea muris]|uniref:hypothetical protein n=1 Tax=Otoolea muris TaxID=2941515 RepID=UPI00203B3F8F|nr:hypothetical protein [Otoolea muris]